MLLTLFFFSKLANIISHKNEYIHEVKMKNFAKAFIFLSIAGMSFSCAKPKSPVYKDGTYTAVSEKDDWGGWADISITVQDKKIVDCVFITYDKDGVVKGKTYGMQDGQIKNAGLYKIAQASVEGTKKYPGLLLEKQNINKIDAVSGATVSHRLFQDAVRKALQNAVE